MDWNGAHWFKADASNDEGCVEIAFLDGKVGVRDTKDRSKPPHVFTVHEWQCFVSGVKNGEFDLP
jgi:Domain of unknown function (DUF397)